MLAVNRIALVIAITGLVLSATNQQPDEIQIQGKRYSLLTFPPLTPPEMPCPKFSGSSSSLWRGYVAKWEIKERKLWLIGVDGRLQIRPITQVELERAYNEQKKPEQPLFDPKKDYQLLRLILSNDESRYAQASLECLFPNLVKPDRVFVSWYSGELQVRENWRLIHSAEGHIWVWDQDRIIEIVHGEVITEKIVDNRKNIPPEIPDQENPINQQTYK
jgi:hypothetical protein